MFLSSFFGLIWIEGVVVVVPVGVLVLLVVGVHLGLVDDEVAGVDPAPFLLLAWPVIFFVFFLNFVKIKFLCTNVLQLVEGHN